MKRNKVSSETSILCIILSNILDCSKLEGIRYFHLFHFTEDREKVNACLSPAIMLKDQMYKWKKVKIPKFGQKSLPARTPNASSASQRKVATKRKLPFD